MRPRTQSPRPPSPRRSAARELRELLAGAPLRPPPADEGTQAPDGEPQDPWESCGWYDSSWCLSSGLQVRECAADEWTAAGVAA
jgi:hypothetical protein